MLGRYLGCRSLRVLLRPGRHIARDTDIDQPFPVGMYRHRGLCVRRYCEFHRDGGIIVSNLPPPPSEWHAQKRIRLAAESQRFARLFDMQVTAQQPASRPRKARIALPTCRHLGEDTGRRVSCGPDKGCKAKVYGCRIHGECVMGEAVGMKSCRGCEQFL